LPNWAFGPNALHRIPNKRVCNAGAAIPVPSAREHNARTTVSVAYRSVPISRVKAVLGTDDLNLVGPNALSHDLVIGKRKVENLPHYRRGLRDSRRREKQRRHHCPQIHAEVPDLDGNRIETPHA